MALSSSHRFLHFWHMTMSYVKNDIYVLWHNTWLISGILWWWQAGYYSWKDYFSFFLVTRTILLKIVFFAIFLVRRKNPTFSISYLIFYCLRPVSFESTTINKISVHLTPPLCNEVYNARCKNIKFNAPHSLWSMENRQDLRLKMSPLPSPNINVAVQFRFFEGSFQCLLPL